MQGEITIGGFTFQPRTSTITKEGLIVRVEAKVTDLLVYLVRHAGEPVAKEQILRDVWAGAFVTEEVLSNAVWKLRHLLGDDPRNPRFIETIPKRGYRLIAPVCIPEHSHPSDDLGCLAVGHEAERAELQDCFNLALSGRGLLVCVSGEAGIGKTTFVRDFLHARAGSECFVGCGKCSERLAGTGAYLPILDALDDLTSSGTDLDLVRLLRHTAPCWYVQVFPHAEDAPALSVQTANSSLERMKRELTKFLREVSNIRPLLLFFDDVHWADNSSVDVWTYLCDRCPTMRILILVCYRPELLFPAEHVFVRLKLALQAHGICREIALSLLSRDNVACYIDKAFPGHCFPQEFTRLIHLRTEGNPLFMVALLAHLRHLQVIVADPGSGCWDLHGPLYDIEHDMPESIQGLIDLKIQLLGDENRRLLVCAAVQGFVFDSAVLARATGSDQSDVEERLVKLDRLYGFIRIAGSSQPADQLPTERYQFTHALYLISLSKSLTPSRLASISGAVARALIEVHGDRLTPLTSRLAFLFEAAREYATAARYFLAAAQQATEASADPEAVTLAQKGLSALSRVSSRAESGGLELSLRLVLAITLMRLRGYADPEVKDTYSRAHDLCLKSKDEALMCRALLGLAACWLIQSDLKKSLEIGMRGLALAESCRDPDLQAWFCLMNCTNLSHMGGPLRALEYARQGLKAHEVNAISQTLSFGSYVSIVGCGQLARILWLCGYPDQARARAAEALAAARKLNHPYSSAFALFLTSWVDRYLGESPSSLAHAEEAIAISIEHGFPMLEGWARALRGWALVSREELHSGIGEIDRGLDLLHSLGCRLTFTEFLGLKALAFLRLGDRTAATATLDEAFRAMQESGELYFEAELHHIRAQIFLCPPTPAGSLEAESWLRRSIAVARQQGSKCFELRAATTLARYYIEQTRTEEAYKELAPTYGWFTEGLERQDLRAAKGVLEACRECKAAVRRRR